MGDSRAKNGFIPFIVIVGFFIQAFSWIMYITEENKANHTPLYVILSVTFTLCLLALWYWSSKAPATQSHPQSRSVILAVAGILIVSLLVLHMMLTVCS